MRNRMSLLLGLALVGLLGCGTLEQQRPAPPVLGGVASGQCVAPDASYACLPATADAIPEGAVWVAEGSCACWSRDKAVAVIPSARDRQN